MADTGTLGRESEQAAERYLRRRGLRVLERNYRCRLGEIDLVADDDGCLVFVEVRRRGGRSLVSPLESVDARKQSKLIAAAALYLAANADPDRSCRFDVIGLAPSESGELRIEWCRDAFRPG